MSAPLEPILARLQADPFFLAGVLACYADCRTLDDPHLADALGCRPGQLAELRLCRAPRADPVGFRSDILQIAERFGLDPQRLAEIVRRGQSLLVLRHHAPARTGPLLAAREVGKEGEP